MDLRARHYATNAPVTVRIADGKIAAITPATESPDLPFIAPGLVDLQINGYRGHDFNRLPLAADALPQATRLLWSEGTTTFYPTFITNSPEAIEQGMRALAAQIDGDAASRAAVPGIHLEGPFISPEDGARGAHAKEFVRAPDWSLFQRWQDASGGRIRIVTMSPEWPDAPAFVERATRAGVTISIGHTAATPQQVADAVRAGARLSTHLGNGAHLMLPRHPNYLWEQLARDELHACLIADGFHLPDQFLKVAMRVKGPRALLVSDAVALAGMPPGTYDMPVGGQVVLTPAGRLHLAANDRLLAGSAQMLPWSIAHLVRRNLASLAEACDMASTRPATLMDLPQSGGLIPGVLADLVLFRLEPVAGAVLIDRTIKAGITVFSRAKNAQ